MAGFFTGLGEDLPSTLQHLKFSMQYSPLHELRRRAGMSTPETGREERKKEKEQEKKTSCCATSRAERTPPCRTSAIQAGPVAPTCSDRSCARAEKKLKERERVKKRGGSVLTICARQAPCSTERARCSRSSCNCAFVSCSAESAFLVQQKANTQRGRGRGRERDRDR